MTSIFDSSDSSSTHSTTSGFSLNLDSNNEKSKETVLSKSFSDKISCAKDFDVPFFTVARYRNPKSPTTYEVAAGSSIERSESAKEFRESLQYLETINSNGRYNKESPHNESSGCNYSLDESNEISKEWLGKSFDMHYSRPDKRTLVTSRSDTLLSEDKNHQSNVPCIQVVSDNKFSESENTKFCNGNNPTTKTETFNKTIVRGFINFFEKSSPKSRNEDSGAKKCPVSRRASTPLSKTENCSSKYQFFYSQISKRNNSLTEVSPKATTSKKALKEKDEHLGNLDKNPVENNSAKAKKKAAYEDARVTDAAEKLNNVPSATHHDVRDSPNKSNVRENHEVGEGVDKLSEKESQYMVEVNKKIADSHERQLIPLKEDLADWLSKLLDENLTSENLTASLENGIFLCRLASLISKKAQEARDKSLSNLEVPSLPYKTWDHARRGTFFARDNISNFLRFCGRLGVHSNLLFETEDLVSGSGVRRVVLCLLEVGRLAHLWWNLEPPGLVKLERDLHKKDDLNQSTLVKEPDIVIKAAPPTPSDDPKKVIPKASSSSPRPPTAVKPVIPPKPASIKRAMLNISKRPTNFTISKSYGRSWTTIGSSSGTRAVTPSNSYKTRLPVAKTPMTSGKTSPNTTPTTPTQCRRYAYMVSIEGSNMNYISSRIVKTSRSVSSKSRVSDAYKVHPVCSKWQSGSKSPDEESKMSQLDLDSQVNKIAEQTEGFCSCHEKRCERHHIKKISDGKYNIHGKFVFVRLLKGKHVMVRVGGGWDTLEHYLIRHDPKQGKLCKTKSALPYLQGKSKHRLEASSTTSLDRLSLGSPDRKKTKCKSVSPSVKTSPEEECEASTSKCQSRVTENTENITVDTKVMGEACESGNCEVNVDETITQESVMCEIGELKNVDLDESLDDLQSTEKEIWSCDLSAPVGEDGNFQSSSFSLGSLMIASNHSLDLI